MYPLDFHLHTSFSFDSEEDLDNVCQAAIAKGLKEIAITDHLDLFTNKEYTYILDCPKWYQALTAAQEKYKDTLLIRKGIEIGTPQANPKETKKFMDTYPLDFVIGSIHNMEKDIDVADYDFKVKDYHDVYPQYIQWLTTIAADYDFDVLGHISYPSRYIQLQLGEDPDLHLYEDAFKALFRLLIEKGHGIELNTSGYARGGSFTMPPLWLLKMYRECGGEIITTGSDSHIKEQVGSTLDIAEQLLLEAGFSYVTSFEQRKPKFHKI